MPENLQDDHVTQQPDVEDEPMDSGYGEEMLRDRVRLRTRDGTRRSSGATKSTEDIPIDSIESELSFEDDTNPSFQYEPLSSPQKSIRLFTLHHGLPLRGTLRQHKLANCPRYQAVSYTWGSKRNDESISLNGQSYKVHHNLLMLLKKLCLAKQQDPVWCDALCINQNDIEERNVQVQQMGKIYEEATTVQVWLGPDADQSNTILECFERNRDDPELWYAGRYGQARREAFWSAFAKLCDRDYWKRTWIVQEFLLAHNIQILCGSNSIPWKVFDHVALKSQNTKFYESQSQVGRAALEQIRSSTFMSLSKDRKLVRGQNLEELLKKYGSTRCADIRDRVFGLVGLANDGHLVQVDYLQNENRLWATIMLSYSPADPVNFSRQLDRSLGLRSLNFENLGRLVKEAELMRSRDAPYDVERLIAFRSNLGAPRDGRLRPFKRQRISLPQDINTLRNSPDVQL
jgi:hypothetical protein